MPNRSQILRFVAPCFLLGASFLAAQNPSRTQPNPQQRFPPPASLRPLRRSLPPQVAYLPITEFKLLSSSTGWAATDNRLLWTADDGVHWKDISPPNPYKDSYASVFFLDQVTGWVLFSHQIEDQSDPIPHNPDSDWTFYIAATQDGGKTWTTILIPAMRGTPGIDLGYSGQIAFAGRSDGWIEAHYTRYSGRLLHTSDGGLHWEWVKNGPGLLATIRAVSPRCLFVAGEDTRGNYLYATWDTGQSFHRISLPRPSAIAAAETPSYALPDFVDSQTGYEAATYSGGEGVPSVAVLSVTRDGGHTWSIGSSLSGIASGSEHTSSVVVDSTWIIPFEPYQKNLSLLKLPLTGSETAAPSNQIDDFDRCRLSFPEPTRGWRDCPLLASTDDGGATWTIIQPKVQRQNGSITDAPITPQTPPTPRAPSASASPESPQALTETPNKTSGALSGGLSQQLGFDINKAPPVSTMAAWWNESPYYDIAIYLLGSPNKGANKRLTPHWVKEVHKQGWGIIPIWFGLQDPCLVNTTGVTSYFSSTPATSYNDGINQANDAYASAADLGLDASIIYLDIEHYTYAKNSVCSLAAQAYISGFVSTIHDDGGTVGVYGSIEDAVDIDAACDQNGHCTPPDYFWLGRADQRASVWNEGHGPYIADLPDSEWPSRERIHQYTVPHSETWGGIPLSIDGDIVDSTIVAGHPSKKPLNVNSAPTPPPVIYQGGPTIVTAIADGTNNGSFTQGTVVGYSYNVPFEQEAGAMPQALPTPPSSSCLYGVPYTVYPTAINDEGTIVGYTAPPMDGPIQTDLEGTPVPDATGSTFNCSTENGIIWRRSGGYVIYNDPDAIQTQLLSINDAGWITGYIVDSSYNPHCILVKPVNGGYKDATPIQFDELGGNCTAAAINGIGIIAGYEYSLTAPFTAFYDDAEGGTPGQNGVSVGSEEIEGVNNNGFVVDPGDIWSLFTPAQYSFPASTTVFGLNDDPEIVGYDTSTGSQEGVIYDTAH